MEKISLKPDPLTKQKRFKVKIDKIEANGDVVLGNPFSNLAIGIVYTWAYDDTTANEFFTKVVKEIGGYSAIIGMIRTVYGLNIAIPSLLRNPNINKWLIIVPNKKDNVHFVVDAIKKLYYDSIENAISANKHINLDKKIIVRFRNQLDLIIVYDFTLNNIENLKKFCDAIVSDEPCKDRFNLNIEFYSHKFNDYVIYDDGARFDQGLEIEPINLCPEIFYHENISIFNEIKRRSVKIDNKNIAWNLILHFERKEFEKWADKQNKEGSFKVFKYQDQEHLFIVIDEIIIRDEEELKAFLRSVIKNQNGLKNIHYVSFILLKTRIDKNKNRKI